MIVEHLAAATRRGYFLIFKNTYKNLPLSLQCIGNIHHHTGFPVFDNKQIPILPVLI